MPNYAEQLLVRSNQFSEVYGCDLYLKPGWLGPDGPRPTGSHKDIWAKAAVGLAKENGATRVAVMSSGNQGLAVAAACQQEGLGCVVCVQTTTDPEYLKLYARYGAEVRIPETPPEQYVNFKTCVDEAGYYPLGVTHTERDAGQDLPAVEAYGQTAAETVMALGSAPDIIAIPTSYADHGEGALREFTALEAAGATSQIPQFILARATEQQGAQAKSIATDVTTNYVEDVVRRSHGQSVFVTDEEMRDAQAEIRTHHGWEVELSSAAGVASLRKLGRDALQGKTVVVVLTALAHKPMPVTV